MSEKYVVTASQMVTQAIGNFLLLLEEGLSRLYPREPRKKLSDENYKINRAKDITDDLINDQSTGVNTGIKDLRIGKVDVGTAGCEVIAVYNSLYLLGKECSFARIERDFEINGALTKVPFVPIGAYGSNPYALKRMIEIHGLNAKRVTKEELLGNPGVYIFSYWNYGGLLKGLHTIVAKNNGKGIELYNYIANRMYVVNREEWQKRFAKRYIIGLLVSEREV